jgi:integrase/recombinase XerD
MLVYASGLRVGEGVRLHPEDLDAEKGLIRIRGGKGRKDRYSLLSQVAWQAVVVYQKEYNLNRWFFPGAKTGRHLTERTAQKSPTSQHQNPCIEKQQSIKEKFPYF